ncbi:MAG TPA: peptidylprolyl isomerase, partial [Chloroflexi bacterium]|nr:peptidylprolyl isomerase [Chloroflexota bacterium]
MSQQQWSKPPEMTINLQKQYTAVIETELGNITLRLFSSESPVTVNNFVFLAKQGYYDGVTFHRVIHNFMVQGGDPTGSGSGGPGYMFEDEVNNGLTFDKPGLLAMANAGPNTNGSQFFITHVPTPHLNNNHTIFGEVIEGMETVFAIPERNPQNSQDDGIV